jgi:hypothetical protein
MPSLADYERVPAQSNAQDVESDAFIPPREAVFFMSRFLPALLLEEK